MSKRALFPTFLVLILLSLIACVSEGPSETTGGTSVAVPSSTATPAPLSAQEETEAPAATEVPPTTAPSPTPVATEGEMFLQLVSPPETEVFTDVGSLTVAGRTRVDAVVTIDDTIVEPNIDGEFSLDVALEEGPNIIEVVASVASGEQMDLVLVVIYLP